jgi:hypothetical protein
MHVALRALRARTHLRSLAAVTGGSSQRVECLVEDLSATGARVVFLGGNPMPKHFDLFVGQSRTSDRVVTVWRRGSAVGVQFLESRANAPEVIPG